MLWNIQPTTTVGWFLVRKVGPFDVSLHQHFGWCVCHLENVVQDDPCEAVDWAMSRFFLALEKMKPGFCCWSYSGLELRAILSLLRALRPGLCWQALHHLKVECLVIQLCSKNVSIHLPTVTRMEITTTSRDKNGVWRFKPMIYRFRVVVSRFSTGRKLSDLNLPGCSESCFSS